MKLYKPKWTDKQNGETKWCQCWHIGFVDNQGIRRRLSAYTSERETEKLGIQIETLLDHNGVLDREQKIWFAGLIPKVRNKLVDFQLIDERSTSNHLATLLAEHLKDFCESLAADNRKANYISQASASISRILDGCELKVWSDIDGNKVKTFLAAGRDDNGGYGQRTYNSHLRAFKTFCVWLKMMRGLEPDPMDNQRLIKQTKLRKKRRPLTAPEVERLLTATVNGDTHNNMTGCERALIYRLALETGARFSEIKSLTVLSFNFDVQPCVVHIEPSDTKGKKPADLILFDETAEAIREFLSGKEPQDKAFAMPHKANGAVMLRKDLAVAGIEYRDASGRDVDFHALRHTFITNLALAKVHPAVAQKLARHSSIELTMNYYTHVLHKSEVEAIKSLHDLTVARPKDAQGRTIADASGQENLDNNTETPLSA